jgi:hypothetical protein
MPFINPICHIATTTTTTHNQTPSFHLLFSPTIFPYSIFLFAAEQSMAKQDLKILYMIKSNTFNLWFSFGV